MTWFGSLDLAWKYAFVFGSLLALTILAGFIKVLYDRKRTKDAAAKEDLEAGRKEEQVELNHREKDEGDLFGIRAIEAGFFAGIAQSRPTSRAGSITDSSKGTPSISTNTLVGSLASPKIQTHSAMSSVTTLPLAHVSDRNRDSDIPRDSSPRRKSPPAIKLRPSEAELNGRINHNAPENMNLAVPPSPALGSPDADGYGAASPRSLSPRSSNFTPEHYAPTPPQIPMPEGLLTFRAALRSPDFVAKSQTASFFDRSPGSSAPPSPALPPEVKSPSMPARVASYEPRPLSPASSERPSLPKVEGRGVGSKQSIVHEAEQPLSPVLLQPKTYQPTNHKREESDSSSVYSDKRMSTYRHQHKRSNSNGSQAYNYSFPEHSSRNSVAASAPMKEHRRRPSASSSLQPPEATGSGQQSNETRFSEFYDAYYRHSQLGIAQIKDASKQPNQLSLAHSTIEEVPSPIPSPNPGPSGQHTGRAWS